MIQFDAVTNFEPAGVYNQGRISVMTFEAVAGYEPAGVDLAKLGWSPGGRLFTRYIRKRARRELVESGWSLIGGSTEPIKSDRVTELLEKLDDYQIIAAGMECGALGDGRFLEFLSKVIQWIVDHQDQILAVLKIVLSILMMLA